MIGILVLCVLYQSGTNEPTDVMAKVKEVPRPNHIAPSFELIGLDGKSYHVGGQRDKLLFINFWASWCEPCHMEARDLQDIFNKYQDQLDLYAINVTYQDSRSGAVDFVSEYELTFPALLDESGDVSRSKYWVDGYPTSFLVNREGIIVESYYGLINKAELEQHIMKWMQ